jgi:hypothetical protein
MPLHLHRRLDVFVLTRIRYQAKRDYPAALLYIQWSRFVVVFYRSRLVFRYSARAKLRTPQISDLTFHAQLPNNRVWRTVIETGYLSAGRAQYAPRPDRLRGMVAP